MIINDLVTLGFSVIPRKMIDGSVSYECSYASIKFILPSDIRRLYFLDGSAPLDIPDDVTTNTFLNILKERLLVIREDAVEAYIKKEKALKEEKISFVDAIDDKITAIKCLCQMNH